MVESELMDEGIYDGTKSIIRLSKDRKTFGEVTIFNEADIHTYATNNFVHVRYDGFYFYQSRFEKLHLLKYFYDNDFLPSGNVLFSDLGGGIWYTKGESLLRLNLQAQHFHTLFDNDSQKRNNAILGIETAAENGVLYAISSDVLHRVQFLDGQQAETPIIVDTLPLTGLTNMLLEDSIIWIATAHSGLLKYPVSKKQIEQFHSKEEIPLRQFFRDKNGTLWIGGNKGMLRLDAAKKTLIPFRGYNADFPKLKNSKVNAFYKNKKGTWLSTSSGIYLLDLKKEKILAHYGSSQNAPYHIPAENIMHLHEDSSGVFWLATEGQGLVRWNPKNNESRAFTKANGGLSNNILYAVREDEFDQLWLASRQGLICFDKNTFQYRAYYKPDGLSYTEFTALAHHKGSDGRLYFGSQNGMVMFYPESFNAEPPKDSLQIIEVVKTKIKDNEQVNALPNFLKKNYVELSPDDKFITIKTVIPNYNFPKGKQYSYRLSGYHDDWVFQDEPSINLSGFPYGKYDLEIRGKTANSKEWVSYPNTVSLQVVKPIYLRWWFILLALLTVVGLIYWLIKRNTRQLLKRQEELETIVEERTAQIRKDKALIEEQAEELRTLDKVKSSFFANVSHELRTPLTLILGPLSYLLDQPEAWDKKEVQEQLLVMQRNGKNLLQLVEEILDLSKLEAHKLELQEEPTSVVSFFEHIFTVFEPHFQSQHLDYELNFDLHGEDLFVMMDRKKMKKVLNNFLSNAIKFTPQRGKVRLDVIEEKALLKIIVSDTGKGVHPKDLPYIFERFYQSKQADQKRQGGTGIGLALVSEFAELMDGRAYAESELGVGSRFYFEFPKQVTEAFKIIPTGEKTEESEADLIADIGTDFTILVVEDTPDMRQFVCGLLSKKGYTVRSATNGLEGLEQLRKNGSTIHLVVSDVMMPEMDGLEMLKAIKSDPALNGTPVVMLTALAGERDKLNALTIGVDDYLTKPFSVTELLTRVQNLLFNYHQRQQWQLENPSDQEHGKTDKEAKAKTAPTKTLTTLDKEWVENTRKKVEESLSGSLIKAEELAQYNNLSTRQFNRKMNRLVGLSAGRFIREVQLETSRKILEDGLALSISEVAYRCGFDYPSTFSNLFKKRYGKSPVAFLRGD